MFNNYAIVQGVDHIVPVDIYLPGCPPRPEMLINAILALHEQIQNEPLGAQPQGGGRGRRGRRAGRDADVADDGAAASERREDRRRRRREAGRRDDGRAVDHRGRARGRLAEHPRRGAAADRGRRRPRAGMFGASGSGDTSGYGGLVTRDRAAGSERAPVRRLVRRGRGHPDRGARRVRHHATRPRSSPSSSTARSSRCTSRASTSSRSRRRCATTRTCGSSSASASRACTTRTTPAASCTPSTTWSR